MGAKSLGWWVALGAVSIAAACGIGTVDGQAVVANGDQDLQDESTTTRPLDNGGGADTDNIISADVDSPPPDGEGEPAGWVPGLVAVGYSSLKLLSRDNGSIWEPHFTPAGSGDDFELLRAAAYGNRIWIATGWKVWKSLDGGISWVDHGRFADHPEYGIPCNFIDGLTSASGTFYSGCNTYLPGRRVTTIFRSSDGITWTRHGSVDVDVGDHLYLDYRDGLFSIWSPEKGTTYQSTDGIGWSVMPGSFSKAIFCDGRYVSMSDCAGGSIWHNGAYYMNNWSGLSRSTAPSFTPINVFKQDRGHVCTNRSIAEGYVAP